MHSQFIKGMMIGAAAGATIGLLFAPKRGAESQRKLAKSFSDFLGTLSKNVQAFADADNGNTEKTTQSKARKVKRKLKGNDHKAN